MLSRCVSGLQPSLQCQTSTNKQKTILNQHKTYCWLTLVFSVTVSHFLPLTMSSYPTIYKVRRVQVFIFFISLKRVIRLEAKKHQNPCSYIDPSALHQSECWRLFLGVGIRTNSEGLRRTSSREANNAPRMLRDVAYCTSYCIFLCCRIHLFNLFMKVLIYGMKLEYTEWKSEYTEWN